MSAAYRTSDASPSAPLPSLAELAAARSMSLSAPSAALAELFRRVSEGAVEEMRLEGSLLGDVVYGAAVTCAIAGAAGVARLAGVPPGGPLFVLCLLIGTLYGVVKVVLWRVRFMDKRTGQDVTIVVPLVVGFGFGFFACLVEIALSLLPVPSVASALVLALAFFALWRARYRPRTRGLGQIPAGGVTQAMLAMADPQAIATIAWNDGTAVPTDGPPYRASIVRSDGVRVTCASTGPEGAVFQVIAEFPPTHQWRHPSPSVSMDGVTLERIEDAGGTRVQTSAQGRQVLAALAMAANACSP